MDLGMSSSASVNAIASASWPTEGVGIPSYFEPRSFHFYEHCLYGKQKRVSFPSSATKSKGILHLIHSDVFGYLPVPSLGKSRYYVSFIDDFSRYTWIYFLKRKVEVFDKFQEFKSLVENQNRKKIKVLSSDNGGEYCSNKFDDFCKKCGIARKKTIPFTPQQNGFAERLNRSLMEMARVCLVVLDWYKNYGQKQWIQHATC